MPECKTHSDITVHTPGMWENDSGPEDWFAISCKDCSIFAYAATEQDAFDIRDAFRALSVATTE